MKNFFVFHEKGGYIHVIAQDKEDALEKYYEALEGIMGHQLKICGCFGDKKPIDRSQVLKPVRVVEEKDVLLDET